MNEIDFLPESYRRDRQRRGRLIRRVALVAVVGALLSAAALGLRARGGSLLRTAERLEATVQAERETLEILRALEEERDQLTARARLESGLLPPVTYSRVLEILGQLMPPDAVITQLGLRSVRSEPGAADRADRDTDRPYFIEIELEGLASEDLAVARLISALDENAMFSKVTMHSSRAVEARAVHARAFVLTTRVDLDRIFRWKDVAEEVARAD